MIVVVDFRRPSSLGVDANLRLEYFVGERDGGRQCCVLGRAGHVEIPTGLIVPTCTQGKMVQVVCRGRPVTATDVSCSRLVDIHETVYGDGFGWNFLIDATLTATRIRTQAHEKIVVLTTNLVLDEEALENGAARFFSETSRAAETHPASISLVFVEVDGSCTGASDSLAAWEKLQRLRDEGEGGTYVLDLIDNTPAMFDSQLRCWLRDSSLRQQCAIRLPATETFSGVNIEWPTLTCDFGLEQVEITPYLLNQGRSMPSASVPALHEGYVLEYDGATGETSGGAVDCFWLQWSTGVWLDTMDQGLCRGDPLLCIPAQRRGSPNQFQANRKLFAAVCAELNGRDMGLLFAVRHPTTSLQERWLLLPQTPPTKSADSGPQEGALSGHGDEVVGALIDRGLLVRLGTKEDVLDEGPTANLKSCAEAAEGSLERAAACASIEVLEKGTYNPLRHSSGLFQCLASLQKEKQQQESRSSFPPSSFPQSTASCTPFNTPGVARGGSARGRDAAGVSQQQQPKKRAVHLRYPEPSLYPQQPQYGVGSHGTGRDSKRAAGSRPKSSGSSNVLRGGGKAGRREKEGARRRNSSGGMGRRDDDESMVL
eukprot:jgi/Undpi1/5640/HiC_scaffold_2.g00915.m1